MALWNHQLQELAVPLVLWDSVLSSSSLLLSILNCSFYGIIYLYIYLYVNILFVIKIKDMYAILHVFR